MDEKFSHLNGLRVYAGSSVEKFVKSINKNIYISVSSESLFLKSEKFRTLVNQSIGYPDGEMAVYGLKRMGLWSAKIPGVEIWYEYLRLLSEGKVFVVGGTEDTINLFKAKFEIEFPKLELVYARNGYLQFEDKQKLEALVTDLTPDVVLIAQGQPLQEYLASDLYKNWECVYFCIGGSLDVFVGKVSRAPIFMQKMKLEWFWRVLLEPKRILRIWKLLYWFAIIHFKTR